MFLLFLATLALIPAWVFTQAATTLAVSFGLLERKADQPLLESISLFVVMALVYLGIFSIIWFGWVAAKIPADSKLPLAVAGLAVLYLAALTAIDFGARKIENTTGPGRAAKGRNVFGRALLLTTGSGYVIAWVYVVGTRIFG